MALVVHKYGGTSVGTIERIKEVAKKVGKAREKGDDLVVVVSAMAGETDKLINLAREVTELPDEREMDLLMSSGERVSAALTAIALQTLGYPARSFTGRQVGILTDDAHTRARITHIDAEPIRNTLKEGVIPVVAGFQGISREQDVTTLGRGGTDTTAVALAAALEADLCIIYTDVDGVFSADPNVVSDARKLDKISYDEMLELASLGAKVLHNRCVEFAKTYDVPLLVKSTFKEGSGTLVTGQDESMEKVVVSGVTCDKKQAKLTLPHVPDRPGIAGKIFGKIAEAGLVVDMIIQNVSSQGMTDISFTVPQGDVAKVAAQVKEVSGEVGAGEVIVDEDIAKVSIVGAGMQSHSGVAAKMFQTLAGENINIQMISTSEIKVSCVIEDKYSELAVRALHDAFELGEEDRG
jgi:aspartate kinase